MGRNQFMKKVLLSLSVFSLTVFLPAQDFRDQLNLIRPKPGNCLIYGPITFDQKVNFSDATVTLLDVRTHETLEKITSDSQGWYLFSVIKGRKQALLIEKDGFFPYYREILIPVDVPESAMEMAIVLPPDLRNVYALYYVPMDTVAGYNSQLLIDRLTRLLVHNPELQIRFESLGDSLDPVRINQLTARFMDHGIRSDRLTVGTDADTLPTGLLVEIRIGREDLAERGSEGVPDLSDDDWTIQFAASRSTLPEKNYRGLDPVFEFKGKDGFYRYTYGSFGSREEAVQKLSMVKKKGFPQAFTKKAGAIRKL